MSDVLGRPGRQGAPFPALLLAEIRDLEVEGWHVEVLSRDPLRLNVCGTAFEDEGPVSGRQDRARAVVVAALKALAAHPSDALIALFRGETSPAKLRRAHIYLRAAVRNAVHRGGYYLLRAVADAENPREVLRAGSRSSKSLGILLGSDVIFQAGWRPTEGDLTERELQKAIRCLRTVMENRDRARRHIEAKAAEGRAF